jgi:hypothetical protein
VIVARLWDAGIVRARGGTLFSHLKSPGEMVCR